MLFVEQRFFVFFLVVFALHWGLSSMRARKLLLLGASYAFYGAWDWRFLGLILLSTLVDYGAGLGVEASEDPRVRKRWLLVSLASNLGLLGFFKYFNFFAESAGELLRWLGLPASDLTLRIVLPVGISFYTFQTMSYTIDVYRRRLRAVRSPLDFALYVTFFPQLVAGPIVRAVDFLPQLDVNRDFRRDVAVRSCLILFLVGYVKKAVLADNAAEVVDLVYADPAAYGVWSNWIALAMYHVQVYGDFSGYSDMAIAAAGLLGYRLTENFDFPYFSPSIGEFWRRWHISLGTWLKDYLYVPLGGSWCPWPQRIRNIYVTMVLCGLWHGAGWQFVAFGALHATYVAVNRAWKHWRPERGPVARVNRWLSPLLTTWCLFLGWTIFRSEGLRQTAAQMRAFLFLGGGERTISVDWAPSPWYLTLFFAGCALVHYGCWRGVFRRAWTALCDWQFALAYGALWALVLPWVPSGYRPFIYFQF